MVCWEYYDWTHNLIILSKIKVKKAKTYMLFKTQAIVLSATTSTKGQTDADWQSGQTQSMLLSATKRKGWPYADLHSGQNPEQGLVRNKEEGLAICWLTFWSKPRAGSCQK